MDQYVHMNQYQIPFAHRVKEFLNHQSLNTLPWSSLGLNPIEMLWIDVDKHIKRKKITNLRRLCARIEEDWQKGCATRY